MEERTLLARLWSTKDAVLGEVGVGEKPVDAAAVDAAAAACSSEEAVVGQRAMEGASSHRS